MKYLFSSKKGFTLLEMLITMVIFFMMITVVTTIFIYVYKTKGALEARQTVTKESYFFLEKLQVMSKDYTIDYEEYRNRRNVGCTDDQIATWNMTGHCTMMTHYGNHNVVEAEDEQDKNSLYYCSSFSSDWQEDFNVFFFDDTNTCIDKVKSESNFDYFWQSYGQYSKMFLDVKDDVDFVVGPIKDDDDLDMGQGPVAIYQDKDNKNYPQELYLISHDKTRRLFFRRKLVEEKDYNSDGSTGDSERLYTIQVLQLRGFDAGSSHNFDVNDSSVYDGVIDTWACDYSLGFVCKGSPIDGGYDDFKLPRNIDDGWQDLLTNDITISQWNILISPLADPNLSWADDSVQINPFFSIQFTANLYGKNRNLKIPRNQMDTYSLKLQTTLSSIFR